MSFYFIANNLHFTLELLGSLCFFIMAWLAVDSYRMNKHYSIIFRIIGLSLMGLYFVLHAFSIDGDILNLFGFIIYLAGIVFVIFSFYSAPVVASLSAVLVIPAFSNILPSLHVVAAVLISFVAYLSYVQMKKEYNVSLRPLFLGFLFLAIASICMVIPGAQNPESIFWFITHLFEVISILSFAFWVWQYLRLRIHESLILIFLTVTILISSIVTLAFSTILISKIEQQTRNSLLVDAKVFDFFVHNLMDKSKAEANFISVDPNIANSIQKNDSIKLQNILSSYLESEKLGLLIVTDKTGTVLSRGHSTSEYGDSLSSERAVEEALIGNPFTTIEYSLGEKLSIRASSPIYNDGKIIGTVVAGFPLDNVMVDGIKKVTGLDTTLYQSDNVIATTALSEDGRSRLVGSVIEDKEIRENVLANGQNATSLVKIKNIQFLASYIPIKNADGTIIGMFSSAKPQADIIDLANTTNRLTLITVTGLLLLLAFPIYIVVRRLLGSSL